MHVHYHYISYAVLASAMSYPLLLHTVFLQYVCFLLLLKWIIVVNIILLQHLQNMAKFAIVEFVTDKSVAVVCTSWLVDGEDKTFCHCPPLSQMTSAVTNCVPVQQGWTMYECRQLYCTGTVSQPLLIGIGLLRLLNNLVCFVCYTAL